MYDLAIFNKSIYLSFLFSSKEIDQIQ